MNIISAALIAWVTILLIFALIHFTNAFAKTKTQSYMAFTLTNVTPESAIYWRNQIVGFADKNGDAKLSCIVNKELTKVQCTQG